MGGGGGIVGGGAYISARAARRGNFVGRCNNSGGEGVRGVIEANGARGADTQKIGWERGVL